MFPNTAALVCGAVAFSVPPLQEKAMTQSELNRMVAQATGESITIISSRGFVPLMGIPYEREPRTVDWDHSDHQRGVWLQPRRKRIPLVV